MYRFGLGVVAAFAVLGVITARASAPTLLKVDGSPGAMPLVAALAAAHEAKTSTVRVEIGKGMGTRERIEAPMARR
ncbi:MAG: hypothetical protein EXQ87_11685 [Alphaproteobacteria bacterium]|nr:hypothetical protein [Alphaproteobacteria bacterium]